MNNILMKIVSYYFIKNTYSQSIIEKKVKL